MIIQKVDNLKIKLPRFTLRREERFSRFPSFLSSLQIQGDWKFPILKDFLITHYVCLLTLLGLLQTNETNHLRLDDLAFKKKRGKKEKKKKKKKEKNKKQVLATMLALVYCTPFRFKGLFWARQLIHCIQQGFSVLNI